MTTATTAPVTKGSVIYDPTTKRAGRVTRVNRLFAVCQDDQGYWRVRLTDCGEVVGAGVNPELLAIAARVKARKA